MKTQTFKLPAHWASALINDDFSGLEDADEAELRAFVNSANGNCIDVSEEPYFSHSNDAHTLACDCLDYTFTIDKE